MSPVSFGCKCGGTQTKGCRNVYASRRSCQKWGALWIVIDIKLPTRYATMNEHHKVNPSGKHPGFMQCRVCQTRSKTPRPFQPKTAPGEGRPDTKMLLHKEETWIIRGQRTRRQRIYASETQSDVLANDNMFEQMAAYMPQR
jgi:hypothetical protein